MTAQHFHLGDVVNVHLEAAVVCGGRCCSPSGDKRRGLLGTVQTEAGTAAEERGRWSGHSMVRMGTGGTVDGALGGGGADTVCFLTVGRQLHLVPGDVVPGGDFVGAHVRVNGGTTAGRDGCLEAGQLSGQLSRRAALCGGAIWNGALDKVRCGGRCVIVAADIRKWCVVGAALRIGSIPVDPDQILMTMGPIDRFSHTTFVGECKRIMKAREKVKITELPIPRLLLRSLPQLCVH